MPPRARIALWSAVPDLTDPPPLQPVMGLCQLLARVEAAGVWWYETCRSVLRHALSRRHVTDPSGRTGHHCTKDRTLEAERILGLAHEVEVRPHPAHRQLSTSAAQAKSRWCLTKVQPRGTSGAGGAG